MRRDLKGSVSALPLGDGLAIKREEDCMDWHRPIRHTTDSEGIVASIGGVSDAELLLAAHSPVIQT